MTNTAAWTYLILAGLLEIVWASSLKQTEGFTRLGPSVFVFAMMAVSFYFLSQAVRGLPVGISYAVWTGIGAAGTAVAGMVFLGESVGLAKMGCIGLILAGVAGLKILSH